MNRDDYGKSACCNADLLDVESTVTGERLCYLCTQCLERCRMNKRLS